VYNIIQLLVEWEHLSNSSNVCCMRKMAHVVTMEYWCSNFSKYIYLIIVLSHFH
jgi:hypothetical protein